MLHAAAFPCTLSALAAITFRAQRSHAWLGNLPLLDALLISRLEVYIIVTKLVCQSPILPQLEVAFSGSAVNLPLLSLSSWRYVPPPPHPTPILKLSPVLDRAIEQECSNSAKVYPGNSSKITWK